MKYSLWLSLFPVATLGCLIPLTVKAQVTTDGTTSTTVNQDGNNFTIEQGDRINDNLFHSFNEFSVPTGGSATFNNLDSIANIFSRVTGSSVSSIDGLLSANGAANLYLINPNGIIFGQNARLDLGGSFFASTADSLLFEGDTEFSAVNPQAPPLLEVNIPIGASFRDNPGDIINQSAVNGVGLQVNQGENITLLGGDINFETGRATARGGSIYLGGLAKAGIVNLSQDGSPSFSEELTKTNITFTNSEINVSGTGGGNIIVNTDNTTLDNSRIVNQVNSGRTTINSGIISVNTASLKLINGGDIDTSTFGRGNAVAIAIDATDNIIIDGETPNNSFPSGITSLVNSDAEGNAGEISIFTNDLNLTNGGIISADTSGKGNTGRVDINATNSITVDGVSASGSFQSGITSLVGMNAFGNSEGINISTNNLNLSNGGIIQASTAGQGNAGKIAINVTNTINIDGEGKTIDGFFPSGIHSQVGEDAIGNSGGVTISTANLMLSDGGIIDATTFGRGNAGLVDISAIGNIDVNGISQNSLVSGITSTVFLGAIGNAEGITISATNLSLMNGVSIDASTGSQGNAGDININISESIFISGIEDSRAGISSSAVVADANGGNIDISTSNLTITNNGIIQAGNFDSSDVFFPGVGLPGNVTINAHSIDLDDGAISATTRSQTGNSANINLTVTEDITLQNNSFISARALENATGGNVTIDAKDGFILAFPNQDNDIVANASQGRGGNIEILTQAIFGLEERASTPPNLTNDIDASSEFGLQGDFSLNTPDFDPTTGLINLPASVGDASDQISQNPCEQGVGSEFIVTGKGGLPPNVNESLNSESAQVGLIETVPSPQQKVGANNIPSDNSIPEAVPAMGWVFNDKGEVTLTAYSNTDTEIKRSPQAIPDSCSVPKNK